MGRPGLRVLPLLAAALAAACSPAYVARSAAGHASLLWRRRSIERSAADPRTPPELQRKLVRAAEVRRFAFDRLALKRSSAYSTWTPVEGPALTWLVSASPRTRLEPYLFRFPLIGAFPYKGHFRKDLADAEAAELERRGYDSAVTGAAAYSTPLPVSDPLPSTVLDYPDGDLAETLIHELTHHTVYVKGRTDFDEAVAQWIGTRGAELFLAERFGKDSPQMKEWKDGQTESRRRDELYKELRERLQSLYDGPGSDADKLERRARVFAWARAEAKTRGLSPLRERLNNAAVLAHELYAPDLAPFDALLAGCGGDWPRTIAALRRRGPGALSGGACAAAAQK